MKRAFAILLACLLTAALGGCRNSGGVPGGSGAPSASTTGTTAPGTSEQTPTEVPAGSSTESPVESAGSGRVLVAYFSATGNTERVAGRIAALTGGELYEIVPAEPYTAADLDYGDSDSRSSREMDDPSARPAIAGEAVSPEEYETVYLGYPIWHGQAPRILSTFVESHNFDGVTVIPFCTSGSSGIGSSDETLAQQAGSGNWLPGERFSSGVSDADLQAWIDGVQ